MVTKAKITTIWANGHYLGRQTKRRWQIAKEPGDELPDIARRILTRVCVFMWLFPQKYLLIMYAVYYLKLCCGFNVIFSCINRYLLNHILVEFTSK